MHGPHKVGPVFMLVWCIGSSHVGQQLGRDAVVLLAWVEHALGKTFEVGEVHRLCKTVF